MSLLLPVGYLDGALPEVGVLEGGRQAWVSDFPVMAASLEILRETDRDDRLTLIAGTYHHPQ